MPTDSETEAMEACPREPTPEMIEAGEEFYPCTRGTESRYSTPNPEDVWRAMWDARPTPSVPAEDKWAEVRRLVECASLGDNPNTITKAIFATLSASNTPASGLVEDFGGRIAVDGLVAIPEALYDKVLATLSATPDQADDVSGLVGALADAIESKMRARRACKREDAAEAVTYEIGLLVCGEPEAILAALRSTPAPDVLPPDVVRLVIAARIVAFEDQGQDALRELDRASEAFASRVPWEDEPDCQDCPRGDANDMRVCCKSTALSSDGGSDG